ncbi:MAG: hypothetical protein ACOYT7_00040 [Patescibacteria group bacterium]
MSLKEKIAGLHAERMGKPLSDGLQETLKKSQLDDILDELLSIGGLKLSREILEDGNKLLLVIHWPSKDGGALNQIILSVRAERIAIIAGADRDHDFISLEEENRFDREKIEDVLAQKFLDPTKVSPVIRSVPRE